MGFHDLLGRIAAEHEQLQRDFATLKVAHESLLSAAYTIPSSPLESPRSRCPVKRATSPTPGRHRQLPAVPMPAPDQPALSRREVIIDPKRDSLPLQPDMTESSDERSETGETLPRALSDGLSEDMCHYPSALPLSQKHPSPAAIRDPEMNGNQRDDLILMQMPTSGRSLMSIPTTGEKCVVATARSARDEIISNIMDKGHRRASTDRSWLGSLRPQASMKWSIRRGTVEPKDLNFLELCQQKFPGKEWKNLGVVDQVEIIREALMAKHFLLDPHSRGMQTWDSVMILALVFTAFVTPYEATLPMYEASAVLFIINRLLDCLFLSDMMMQFFMKVEVSNIEGYGKTLIKDPKKIREVYLKGFFAVDVVSMLPVDLMVYLIEDKSMSLQRMRLIRCLRLLKLLKLLRIVRSSRLIVRWQNYLAISFAMQKLVKFVALLLLSSHWMACFWSLTGHTYGALICSEAGRQLLFDPPSPSEASWITTLYLGGKYSPDDPCNSLHVYSAALHWSMMTITGIGYGDIVPVRYEEYAICVACQAVGAFTYAYVIGCVCSILSNGDPIEEKFEADTDLLNTVLHEAQVPHELRLVYRSYLRAGKRHEAMALFRNLAQGFSPLLRSYLMTHMSEKWISNVWYFRAAPTAVVIDVAETLEARFYTRRESLHDIRFALVIVERGAIAHGGLIVTNGSVFGQDFIITNRSLQMVKPTVSLTYCRLLVLDRDHMEGILAKHPVFERDIRRFAVKLAMCRVARQCARKSIHLQSNGMPAPTLVDAFGMLDMSGEGERLGSTRCMSQLKVDPGREMRLSLAYKS